MKTLTLLGCTTFLAVALAGCGSDPITLGEIIDVVDDSESPQENEPLPPSPGENPLAPEDDPEEYSPEDPGPSSPEDLTPLEVQVVLILTENCGDCHIGQGAVGGLGYINDLDLLIENGMIIPGSKEDSPVYARMENQSMPPAFVQGQRPTLGEIDLIGQYIDDLE